MNTKSTDLDRNFAELPNKAEFTKFTLLSWLYGCLFGCFVGFLITYGALTIFDPPCISKRLYGVCSEHGGEEN